MVRRAGHRRAAAERGDAEGEPPLPPEELVPQQGPVMRARRHIHTVSSSDQFRQSLSRCVLLELERPAHAGTVAAGPRGDVLVLTGSHAHSFETCAILKQRGAALERTERRTCMLSESQKYGDAAMSDDDASFTSFTRWPLLHSFTAGRTSTLVRPTSRQKPAAVRWAVFQASVGLAIFSAGAVLGGASTTAFTGGRGEAAARQAGTPAVAFTAKREAHPGQIPRLPPGFNVSRPRYEAAPSFCTEMPEFRENRTSDPYPMRSPMIVADVRFGAYRSYQSEAVRPLPPMRACRSM